MLWVVLSVSILLILISMRKFSKALNPFTLEVYFIVMFLIVPQLIFVSIDDKAETYFYSDLAILVYVMAIFIGTLVPVKGYQLKGIQNVNLVNSLNVVMYCILIMPILPMLLSYGLNPGGFRQFYENVVFSKFASFYELSKIVLYFIIFFKLIRRQEFGIWFFILFPFIFFYGSRFVILDFIIYLFIFLEHFRNLPFKKLVPGALVAAGVILVYSYFQFSQHNLLSTVVAYFDIYQNQSLIIKSILEGKRDYYYGEIYGSSFLKYIPRILWPEKPHAFGFAILNYDIFPELAAKGHMPSFGLGSMFADFGYIGLASFGFFTGLIRKVLYNCFLRSKNNTSFFLFAFSINFIIVGFLIIHHLLDELIQSTKRGSVSTDNSLQPGPTE